MKVVLFGATGMIGQGVLRECLLAPDVESVLTIVRRPTGERNPKLHELVHGDFSSFSEIRDDLTGHDACFFCLGVSSVGLTERAYAGVTYDITLAAAHVLVECSPGMTFVFVSGMGTDSSGTGRTMWARVKGRTENALLALPFKATYLFRPAFIQPLHGIASRTALYRALYAATGPLFPVFGTLFPRYVTTTERIGRAMLEVARHGSPERVLENSDINGISERAARPLPP
jgi:uncharacterized protein YbjT (DUF2867 family)